MLFHRNLWSLVDPAIVRFAADLDWLKTQGVSVERFNLSQQPAAFVDDAAVKSVLEAKGEAGLPLIKVNDEVKSSGVFPSRADLASWAGVVAPAASLFSDAVCELVALGAAVAANCEPSFKSHYDRARKLGVSVDDLQRAVATAEAVRAMPAHAMHAMTEHYLHQGASSASSAPAKKTLVVASADACCSPAAESTSTTTPSSKNRCC